MRLVFVLAAVCLISGCIPDRTPTYVACTDKAGVSTRTATAAEWLFIDGAWNGYADLGEARAFPSATYTPAWGSACRLMEDRW